MVQYLDLYGFFHLRWLGEDMDVLKARNIKSIKTVGGRVFVEFVIYGMLEEEDLYYRVLIHCEDPILYLGVKEKIDYTKLSSFLAREEIMRRNLDTMYTESTRKQYISNMFNVLDFGIIFNEYLETDFIQYLLQKFSFFELKRLGELFDSLHPSAAEFLCKAFAKDVDETVYKDILLILKAKDKETLKLNFYNYLEEIIYEAYLQDKKIGEVWSHIISGNYKAYGFLMYPYKEIFIMKNEEDVSFELLKQMKFLFENNGIFKKSRSREINISNILVLCESLGDDLSGFLSFVPVGDIESEPPLFSEYPVLPIRNVINIIRIIRNFLLNSNLGYNLKAMKGIKVSI